MTNKDKKTIAKLVAGIVGFYFLIAFWVMSASPDIPWDTALVRAGHQSFWFAVVVGAIFYGAIWFTAKLFARTNRKGR